ncbi:hypothetical protein KBZ10_13460 [Streptomyces sp. F63]|uniref:hypothetical protein n=1 Tax=Streptomyces sp. F63 TaxID=2824887 RepID=UPI001B35ABC7|nr:hypothetical protein [Streptomyces sp. F63]MBQ0985499.1 hypothetical protein [Streptomyces sp. F63]
MTSPAAVPPPAAVSATRLGRSLEPTEWAAAGIPLLRDPREIVTGLHTRHRPATATVVAAVLDTEQRVVASASFAIGEAVPDGWVLRNALLDRLRRIVPHDLRLRNPVRTGVLLHCRDGDAEWTPLDGAWMWGLRDACTLHGLRCGAFIVLTPGGWRVLGEGRGGRHPRAVAAAGASRAAGRTRPAVTPRRTAGGAPEARRRTAAR